MKTAGQILRGRRIKKNLKIAQVARATKIRPFYLKALEEDDYQKLPSATSARGFIKNYAEFLGLSSDEVLAIFRRDFSRDKVKKFSSQKMIKPIVGLRFAWTPKLTTIAIGATFALLFIGYLIWQYYSLLSAPYY